MLGVVLSGSLILMTCCKFLIVITFGRSIRRLIVDVFLCLTSVIVVVGLDCSSSL